MSSRVSGRQVNATLAASPLHPCRSFAATSPKFDPNVSASRPVVSYPAISPTCSKMVHCRASATFLDTPPQKYHVQPWPAVARCCQTPAMSSRYRHLRFVQRFMFRARGQTHFETFALFFLYGSKDCGEKGKRASKSDIPPYRKHKQKNNWVRVGNVKSLARMP